MSRPKPFNIILSVDGLNDLVDFADLVMDCVGIIKYGNKVLTTGVTLKWNWYLQKKSWE